MTIVDALLNKAFSYDDRLKIKSERMCISCLITEIHECAMIFLKYFNTYQQ